MAKNRTVHPLFGAGLLGLAGYFLARGGGTDEPEREKPLPHVKDQELMQIANQPSVSSQLGWVPFASTSPVAAGEPADEADPFGGRKFFTDEYGIAVPLAGWENASQEEAYYRARAAAIELATRNPNVPLHLVHRTESYVQTNPLYTKLMDGSYDDQAKYLVATTNSSTPRESETADSQPVSQGKTNMDLYPGTYDEDGLIKPGPTAPLILHSRYAVQSARVKFDRIKAYEENQIMWFTEEAIV